MYNPEAENILIECSYDYLKNNKEDYINPLEFAKSVTDLFRKKYFNDEVVNTIKFMTPLVYIIKNGKELPALISELMIFYLLHIFTIKNNSKLGDEEQKKIKKETINKFLETWDKIDKLL